MAKTISQPTVKAQANIPVELWRRAKAKAIQDGHDSSAMMIIALKLYLGDMPKENAA